MLDLSCRACKRGVHEHGLGAPLGTCNGGPGSWPGRVRGGGAPKYQILIVVGGTLGPKGGTPGTVEGALAPASKSAAKVASSWGGERPAAQDGGEDRGGRESTAPGSGATAPRAARTTERSYLERLRPSAGTG